MFLPHLQFLLKAMLYSLSKIRSEAAVLLALDFWFAEYQLHMCLKIYKLPLNVKIHTE